VKEQPVRFSPSFHATFEIFSPCTGIAQPGSDALAQPEPLVTHNRDGPAVKFAGPRSNAAMIALDTCGKHARIGDMVHIRTNI
jgi:hypothetical protein